ncbi:MAG: ABC transporter substrate-binding protein [Actinobacteria bacterium 13_2_20CM_2_71_6]|nr:MAG: ABC transporter substrate-binding protein [Actinobacteria bacterium 13_2_20CM_2_71_6]
MIRLRRGSVIAAACLASAALVVAGCTPSAKPQQVASAGVSASGSIEFWHFFTDREAEAIQKVVDDFQAKYPAIKVTVKSGQDDDKVAQAIGAGGGPDAVLSGTTDNVGKFCSSGAWQDLAPYIKRDNIDINQIPKPVQEYTQYQGKRCAMPFLNDAYGLYYNKKMFAAAGITSPPKTLTELADDAKKLTTKNGDGSFKVLGFDPLMGFYENSASHLGPMVGGKWLTGDNKSAIGGDPAWQTLLNWQKGLIDYFGYDKLNKFQSTFGDEFSADNAFHKGQVAMNVDGEYRIAFLDDQAKDVDYGVAPLPVADDKADLYGSGYITGNIIGVTKNTKNAEAAWQFIRYLTTNTDAVVKLANGIKNVPTLTSALKSSALQVDDKFKVFIDISSNAKTSTTPPSSSGPAYQQAFAKFIEDWQAGSVKDLAGGLKKLDGDINQQLALGG